MHPDLLAHVKWFADPKPFPTQYGLLFTLPLIAAYAIALGAIVAAYLIQRRFPEPRIVKVLERFSHTGPLILGLHLGVALVAAATVGLLFVPSLRPDEDLYGRAILVVEAMCGLMILLGLATRAAAILLVLLGVVAMQPFTFESILENVHIVGIAAFLFIVGRGPISLDRIRGVKPPTESDQAPAAALTLLRVALGFGIAYGALTEKLLNPGIAQSLLDRMPFLNVGRPFGLGDPQFAYAAGLTEFVIGCVVLSGQLTRPAAAIGAAIFTATLPMFGWSEFLGHLPFYGIMFMLFIAPNADSWRVREGLRPRS
jgi:uncharacterized membrane protein YphA (DoxX/SURF4 family)